MGVNRRNISAILGTAAGFAILFFIGEFLYLQDAASRYGWSEGYSTAELVQRSLPFLLLGFIAGMFFSMIYQRLSTTRPRLESVLLTIVIYIAIVGGGLLVVSIIFTACIRSFLGG